MSADNIEIALAYTAAISEGRVPEELLAPDLVIENVETAVTDRTYRGRDGLRQWMADLFEAFGDVRYEANPIASGEDWVIGDITISGRGSASGAPLELRHYGVMWIENGLITRAVGYPSRRAAFAAVDADP